MAIDYTPIPRLVVGAYPLTTVQPFTHRDGWTYARKLEWLIHNLNDWLGKVNAANKDLYDAVIEQLNAAIDVVNAKLEEQSNDVNASQADMQEYVDAAVTSIINSTIDVSDPVFVAIIGNTDSNTRQLLNSLYANKSVESALADEIDSRIDGDAANAEAINKLAPRHPGRVSIGAAPGIDIYARDYNQSLCLFNESSADMHTIRRLFREALAGDRHVVVSAIGHSKLEGYGTQNYGNGMFGGSPTYRLMQLIGGKSGVVCLNDYDGRTTFSGASMVNAKWAKWMNTSPGEFVLTHASLEAFTSIEIFYRKVSPNSTPLRVTIDGVVQPENTMAQAADGRFDSFTYDGLSNTSHLVTISAGAGVIIPAVRYNPDRTSGLEISNFARSSSAANDWLPNRSANGLTDLWAVSSGAPVGSSGINKFPKPDVWIVETGLNGSVDADILTLIGNVKDTGARVLMLGPGGYANESATAVRAQRQTMYQAANTHDLPLIDFMDRIGYLDEAKSRGLISDDNLHETYRGYVSEAALLAQALRL